MAYAFLQCCSGNPLAARVRSPQRLVISVRVQAAARSEENQQPKIPEPAKQWDEHLIQQSQQSDSYRPPSFGPSEIELARKKFLGRLATLLLGVGALSVNTTHLPGRNADHVLALLGCAGW